MSEHSQTRPVNTPGGYHALKRVLDVCGASTGLLALSPLIAALSLAVRLDSPGPAFYRSRRVGKNGAPIDVLKLRTMHVPKGSEGENEVQLTAHGDPRITRFGRFLRKSKLDELPQLVNVLKGEMSLVGPRPEVAEFVAAFPEDYARILSVRPGMTDEAAIAYIDEEYQLSPGPDLKDDYIARVLPAKIRLYHQYLDHPSLTRDIAIIAKTCSRILCRTR